MATAGIFCSATSSISWSDFAGAVEQGIIGVAVQVDERTIGHRSPILNRICLRGRRASTLVLSHATAHENSLLRNLRQRLFRGYGDPGTSAGPNTPAESSMNAASGRSPATTSASGAGGIASACTPRSSRFATAVCWSRCCRWLARNAGGIVDSIAGVCGGHNGRPWRKRNLRPQSRL